VATVGGTIRTFEYGVEEPVGILSTTMTLTGAERHGNLVVVYGYDAVEFIDITDPASPVSLARLSIFDTYVVRITDDAVFLLVGASQVFRISATETRSESVASLGHMAVGDGFVALSGVGVIEIRDPETLGFMNFVMFLPHPVASLSASGRHLVALLQNGEVLRFDLSDPSNPQNLGSKVLSLPVPQPFGTGRIEAEGDRALVEMGSQCVELRFPEWSEDEFLEGGDTRSLGFVTGRFCAANGLAGFLAVTDDAVPPFAEGAERRLAIGETVFVDGFERGDASTWTREAGESSDEFALRVPGAPAVLLPEPDPIVLAATAQGLSVVELVRGRPVEIGGWSGGPLVRVAAAYGPAGQRLALALATSSFQILDLSDPTSPVLAASRALSEATTVCVDGSLAVVTQAYSTTQLLDLSDPTNPVQLGSLGGGFTSAIDEGYVYIGRGDELNVYDVTNPSSPVFVDQLRVPSPGHNVDVRGITIEHRRNGSTWAWLGAGLAGVVVVDVTDPTNMFVVTSFDTPSRAWDVVLHRGFVWVADGASLLQLRLNRGSEAEAALVAEPAPVGEADARGTSRSALDLAAFPNPSRGPATLSFSLPHAGRAALAVYDVAGRQLARVADATFSAGRHELTWDGRDDAGRRVAAGVYLLRLEAGSVASTRRVVRLD
jgi:hypothetical protein